MNSLKTYEQLLTYKTFKDRYLYSVLDESHNNELERSMLQSFYRSALWRRIRNQVITRDYGYDLAVRNERYIITGRIIVHHLNPIKYSDVYDLAAIAIDPDYMITVSEFTHNALHTGVLWDQIVPVERFPRDTILW